MLNDNLPMLLMLIGIPGSGKSSWLNTPWSKQYFKDFILLSPDALRKQLCGNVSDQSANIQVWAEVKEKASSFLSKGTSVIIDATNVNTKYRREFISGLPPCKMVAKFFEELPHICCNRVNGAIEKGEDRANVPEEVIYRMYGEYLYTKKVYVSEGFVPSYPIF